MNNKREKERDELHKTIWKIADELRGSVDGWDFKQYVLGLLFYRFISENIENYVNKNQRESGEENFEYRNLSDEEAEYGREDIVKEKGFFILPSELFCNVRKKAKSNPDLNITINKVFENIEASAKGTASEDDVKGLFDDFDVKGNKLGNTVDEKNEKLIKMIDSIGDLKLGNYSDNTIDAFGDAYEFLMTMYASNAGKSGGEFFTPQEVGELLARITLMDQKDINKVYDPCCGSGGLLLRFKKILNSEDIEYYGQEINLTTYNLARINMFLHDINYTKFNIARGNTLTDPKHDNYEPFDAIVSNPPYSIKWAGKSDPILINDSRYSPAGILAPESKADLAFTMHMLSYLSTKGTAAIVQFPGVLYRGGAEQKIRKYMVDSNFVDTVIQLPSDLFFGTSIATCILVLKKSKKTNDILFIDASNEFVRNTNKNKLTTPDDNPEDNNVDNILKLIKDRTNVENKSIVISNEEVANNDYNISVNSYLKAFTEKNKIDIKEVNKKIVEVVKRESEIRIELDKIIQELEEDSYEQD